MSEAEYRTEEHKPMASKLLRGAIWIAIGALIAAALVCVVWVLIGDQDGIIGRAFMTILLLALFAGIAIAESHMADRRPDWLALASMITWIVALLVGAVKIWMPEPFAQFGWMTERLFQFLLVIGVMQLALLHVRLFVKASQRYVTTFTRVIVMVTFAMLAGLVAMLVFYLTFPDLFQYSDLYWRIVIALAILAAVGTTLIPLLNALFAPRVRTAPRAADFPPAVTALEYPQGAHAWPTYADGRTPLPVMPDGSPDWNAYYTGFPTPNPYVAAPSFPVLDATAPAAPQPIVPPQPTNPQPPVPQFQPAEPAPAAQPAPPQPAEPTPPQPTLPTQPVPPAAAPQPTEPPAPGYPAHGSFPPPPAPPVPPTAPGAPQ
ncbi:hypothetical protein [Microbacterium sp. H1-D42]|uniref:hypothetical protein n=1 Tax=Microbacterium sp. H1-D42 TaxID=2925844 RepID=UPI001F53CF58|nr:hypothetical protein [Microbacterium sp. H1-D42]UNK70165.1 hypothetical protein MNR00_13490 [Microbacterium sp. H1-D42]